MRIRKLLLGIAKLSVVTMAFSSFAAEERPVEVANGRAVKVTLHERDNSVAVAIQFRGREQWIPSLGERFQYLHLDGTPVLVATRDYDRDGIEEVIVRVTVPPRAGGMYVFRFDGESFVPARFAGEEMLSTDFSAKVIVLQNGDIEAHYPKTSAIHDCNEVSVVETWSWANGQFSRGRSSSRSRCRSNNKPT